MEPALKSAVRAVLDDISVRTNAETDPTHAFDRFEYGRLRKLREDGLMRPLAARLAILATLGWKRTEMAEALDVSRVTINNWLRDHTDGADTYKPYGADALAGDPDTLSTDQVTATVTNKLTQRNAEMLAGVKFEHDKFVVPEGIGIALDALWRVAYRARGPELTTDKEVAAAGDALDVLISLLLRRGVTNLAIAKAAGVTHRAVLDRMNRARQRGLILSCGREEDACEAFYGEDDVRRVYGDCEDKEYDAGEWIINPNSLKVFDLVPIRVTSARPSRYWLQTMVDLDDDRRAFCVPSIGEKHKAAHARLHIARYQCMDDNGARAAYDELGMAMLLGRMNEDSPTARTIASLRDGTMFVPASMLYTESNEKAGNLPKLSVDAMKHVPKKLWGTYFAPYPLVMKCFVSPQLVRDEYEPTVKHKPDAKTRQGFREAV